MINSTVWRLFFILITSVAISGSSVQSQDDKDDWRSIGTLSLRAGIYSVYYSRRRIVRRNGVVRGWFKVVEPEASSSSHSYTLVQFNCREGKYRLLQQSIFNRNGGGTGSIKPTEWQYPVPVSVPELEYWVMCQQARVK